MFRHELVEASSCLELRAKLSPLTTVKVLKPLKELTSRESAFSYLENKRGRYSGYSAVAVPVKLPVTPEYSEALSELNRLCELLKVAVRPWARDRLETKVVEQAKLLRYMETQVETGALHWAVYRAEEKADGQHVSNRPLLQRPDRQRSDSLIHA